MNELHRRLNIKDVLKRSAVIAGITFSANIGTTSDAGAYEPLPCPPNDPITDCPDTGGYRPKSNIPMVVTNLRLDQPSRDALFNTKVIQEDTPASENLVDKPDTSKTDVYCPQDFITDCPDTGGYSGVQK